MAFPTSAPDRLVQHDQLKVQHAFHAGRLLLGAITALGFVQGRLSAAGWWGLVVLLAAVAALVLAAGHALGATRTATSSVPDWIFIAIDAVLALGVITLMSDSAAPLVWVALVVPVAEAALAFNLAAAVAVWGAIGLFHLSWVLVVQTETPGEESGSLLFALQQMLAVLLLAIPASLLASSVRAQLRRLETANTQAGRDAEALRFVGTSISHMSELTSTDEVFRACVEATTGLGFPAAEVVTRDGHGWSVLAHAGEVDRPIVAANVLAESLVAGRGRVELLADTEQHRQELHLHRAGFGFAFPLQTAGTPASTVLRVWGPPGARVEDGNIDAVHLLAGQTARLAETVRAAVAAEQRTEELAYRATHDPLTSLANHSKILATLQQAANANDSVSVLFIDLDGFKPVNDNHGHEAGDQALVIVAERLRRVAGERAMAGRLGGDEFVLIGPTEEMATEEHPFGLGLAALDAISEPITVNGTTVSLGASIGATRHRNDGASGEELLQRADQAMYRAKQTGTGLEVWQEPSTNASAVTT